MFSIVRRDELGHEATVEEVRDESKAKRIVESLYQDYPECEFWYEQNITRSFVLDYEDEFGCYFETEF